MALENTLDTFIWFAVVFFAWFLLLFALLYIYLSFAYSSLGRKARLKSPGLAWIPGVGPIIIAYQASKAHWWPWILLVSYIIPFVGIITGLVFMVYVFIWHWKLFEAIGRPGWWALLMLIPIVNFVMIGVAAWGNNKQIRKTR